jgi:hypothetical protein
MNEVFINYRNADQPNTATLIERDLSRRFGSERVFRASKSIRPSENFAKVLRANVRNCRVVIAVIGDRWLLEKHGEIDLDALRTKDDWTKWEIQEAFRCDKPVLPVMIGRTTKKLPLKGVPSWVARLAGCQYVRFDSRNADADLDQLARAVSGLVPELVESGAEPGRGDAGTADGTANTATGSQGPVLQARDHVHQQTGGIGSIGTVVSHPTGPVHTGSGDQFNGPYGPPLDDRT